MGSDQWEWFCGKNNSELPDFDNFSWNYEQVFSNQCLVDAIVAIPQAAFIVLSALILVFLGCCTAYRHLEDRVLIRYPGHILRWLGTFVLVVMCLASVAEGILTDSTYVSQPTQPHLYLTGIGTFVSGFMALFYFHCMEKWRSRHMSWLLCLYWLASIAVMGVQLEYLIYQGFNDVHVTVFSLTIILTFVYSCFLLIELYSISQLFFGCCGFFSVDDIPADLKKDKMYYMEMYTNLLSQLMHWWMNWLFILGFKKPLEVDDLGNIPEVHTAEYNHVRFRRNLIKEFERAKQLGKDPSLARVYAATFWPRMLAGAFLKLVCDLCAYVGPLAIGGITLYVTDTLYGPPDTEPPHPVRVVEFFANGYVLIGCIFVTALIRHMCDQTYQFWTSVEGIHVRSALQSTIYEKSLRLSTYAMSGGMMTMGQVTNHMSVDANNIMMFFQFGNEIWATPVKLIVALIFLYLEMGTPSLIGASVFLIVIPFQLAAAVAMTKFMKAVLTAADFRLKKSNEMLQGIKLLKLYGWERIYYAAIKKARVTELYALLKVYVFFAVTFVINASSPIIVTLVSFGTYTPITGNPLTPDVAFTTLALFNQMAGPLFMFPFIISLAVNCIVSTKRLRIFLTAPEVENKEGVASDLLTESAESAGSRTSGDDDVKFKQPQLKRRHKSKKERYGDDAHELPDKTPLLGGDVEGDKRTSGSSSSSYGSTDLTAQADTSFDDDLPPNVAIRIRDGSFTWDPDSSEPIISDINVDIPRGKLTIIIGVVGSGKSSLLHAMLNEMTTLSGSVKISRHTKSMAYAPQKAWLVNATLKNNILFGEETENSKYRKVINACALQPDIDMLPGKDQTEIGEKGINLSGGQKQRISVARTLYSERDIIILDDPLSALDMHVGSHLFEKGIQGILRKSKQTVVLVTHQLQYLQEAEKIIVMKDGRIHCQGTPEEVAEADPLIMADSERALKEFTESEAEGSGAESETVLEERRALKKQISRQLSMSVGKDKTASASVDERGRLIEEEEKEKGSVSYKMYLYYFGAMGYPIACMMVGTVALRIGLQVSTNFWLSDWSSAGLNLTGEAQPTSYYIRGYAGLSFATVVGSVMSNVFGCIGALLAARAIHYAVVQNIIGIPMRFFDTTPVGRILNRLSSDTQWIDQRLVHTFGMLLNTLAMVIASLIVNGIVNPYFLIFVIPIGIVFFFILVYFVATSRMLQRLESVTRSPVFAHFSESLGGLPIIRAYRDEKRFFRSILDKIDKNNTAFVYLLTANRWLAIRLDYLGAIIVLVAGLSALLGALYLGVESSLVGLALTYSLEIALFMNMVVRGCADLELQMNAIERIKYYTEVKNENYDGTEPPSEWPEKGEIVLEDISVRYATELDPVLHDVSVNIPAGQKLGICGRTGSGKSSLTLALFRIIDTFKGRILIDGVDIAHVPLITLRQRLSIIPQDAVLFTATIRQNLDPGGTKTDNELWKALEIAQLKDVVSQLDSGLDYMVTEGGENFSVGQRQLFCLARAFLRNSRILVMDEATASIDQETDRILQDVVADVFRDRTVITIAHRVGTILDSDNILTLSDGRVVEFDTPTSLLENDDSIFNSLVKAGK